MLRTRQIAGYSAIVTRIGRTSCRGIARELAEVKDFCPIRQPERQESRKGVGECLVHAVAPSRLSTSREPRRVSRRPVAVNTGGQAARVRGPAGRRVCASLQGTTKSP